MSLSEKYDRRALLKRLGAGMALLPILECDWAHAAACAGVSGPKRAFFIVWANGMHAKSTTWAGVGDNFTLPTHMKALEPHRAEILLLDGIDYKFIKDSPNPSGGEVSGHACFQGMLTGKHYQSFGSGTASNVAGAQSIDQFIGKAAKAKGFTGLTSINTQSWSRSTARLSWRAAGDPIVPDHDPFHVYSTVFAGRTPPTTTTTPATPTTTPTTTPAAMPVDKMLLMRKSILDYVMKDITRFSATVGTADKVRIESHLQSVRDIEQQLSQQITAQQNGGSSSGGGTMAPAAGTACQFPVLGSSVDAKANANFPKVTKMQIDLAIAAFAADITRVVVLQLGDQGDPDLILTELGFSAGAQDGNTGNINAYHSVSHRNGADKEKYDAWFQQQLAYTIAGMKNVSEANGKTLLDNSVMIGLNNMRTGNHEYVNVPVVMAGNCGGYFKTGRSLKLTNTPNNGLLIAVANAVGTPTETFGEASYGGELAALRS